MPALGVGARRRVETSLDPAGKSACATMRYFQPFFPHIPQKLNREFNVMPRGAEAAVGSP
jgi:hypothetical protein